MRNPSTRDAGGLVSKTLALMRDFTRTYFRTIVSVASGRLDELSVNGQRFSAETLFLVSCTLSVALEKTVWPGAEPFEVPETVGKLKPILELVPQHTAFLVLASACISAILPYIVLKALRSGVTIRQVVSAYCYVNGGIYLPFNILIMLLLLFGSQLLYGRYLVGYGWLVVLPVGLYGILWLVRYVEHVSSISRTKSFASFVSAGIVLVAVGPMGLLPTSSYYIPNGSMEPTVRIGDIVVANRWTYSWRVPKRGELVVFRRSGEPTWLNRVIGLPGDTVRMLDGQLYINGEPVRRERVEDFVAGNYLGEREQVRQFRETLPNGVSYRVLDLYDNSQGDTTDLYRVPPEHYFMMGDNRDNSIDSRHLDHVGFVPSENIVGHIYRRILPTGGGPL